jgi:hypothetical protein
METGLQAMAQALLTMTFAGSIISLLVGILPMLWGQVRVKWMLTSMISCVMFGLVGIVIEFIADPPPETKPVPRHVAPPREIDWSATALLLLAIAAVIAAVVGARRAIPVVRRHRAQKAERALARRMEQEEQAKARLLASNPAQVALTFAPDMTEDVDRALKRIALLKSVGDRASRPEDADALVMIDRRVPSVMDLYLKASEVCTPEERAAAARTALGSIVDIGRMAEDARQRIARDLRDDLDTESRYISSRTGRADGLGLD